ncbi:hypothetical protein GF338_05940 [candidate division WOR-3 bacterium]|nr:hypothetical protein [candidate division WOR-3 bacterium]
MSRETSSLSDTQKGTIGEYLISSFLILESNGRLSPAFTWADDSGIDLIVYDKETKKTIPVQVKSRLKPDNSTIQFDVRKATFKEAENSCLVAAWLDIESKNIGIKWAWLIPFDELKQIARETDKNYVITPSWKDESKDKYEGYRYKDMKELTERLIKEFDEG